MGKTPIVVNDCPGFHNQVLFPYFAGFSQLLRDGADFRKIDKVMEKQFGWPMGPAYLLDVVGIDTAHHAQAVMAAGFPQRMQKDYRDAIDALFDANRFGQKNGLGFWRYKEDSKGKPKKEEDAAVEDLLAEVSQPKRDFSEEEIIARMMIPMVNEVVRCRKRHTLPRRKRIWRWSTAWASLRSTAARSAGWTPSVAQNTSIWHSNISTSARCTKCRKVCVIKHVITNRTIPRLSRARPVGDLENAALAEMANEQVVIVDAIRTLMGRSKAVPYVRAEDLSAHLMRSLLARNPALEAAALDDIY